MPFFWSNKFRPIPQAVRLETVITIHIPEVSEEIIDEVVVTIQDEPGILEAPEVLDQEALDVQTIDIPETAEEEDEEETE